MIKLPETEKAFWREAYPESLYDSLANDIEVDVAIVGAGITGLSVAYLLKKSGLRVAVLEKHTVGGGTTGRTTGKVTSQHNLMYDDMEKKLGTEKARIYGEANQSAIEKIAQIIENEKIDCGWVREDNYVFSDDPTIIEQLKREAEVAARLGLPATFETDTALPMKVLGAVRFKDQAKFHSVKYLLGLARCIHGEGSYIFENSTAIGIRDGDPCRIKTSKGSVLAKDVIVASSVPTLPLIARGAYGILEYPSESYIVAGKLPKPQKGMYISPDKHHYSILPTEDNDEQMILIGGESHFFGLRGNRTARFERLANYAEKHFGVSEITHHWSDRDYLAYDNVPIVGKLYPWSKHVYVGTAFKKWGLTNGTVAAMILSDAITNQKNEWATTFRSNRLKTITSIPSWFIKYVSGK